MKLFKSKDQIAIEKIQAKLKGIDEGIKEMNAQLDKALNKECIRDCGNCPQKDCPNRRTI